MENAPKQIESLGGCYLDEIYASDPFLFELDTPQKTITIYQWTQEPSKEVAALFPNLASYKDQDKLTSTIQRLISTFYDKQTEYKERLLNGITKSKAITIRKDCKKLLGFYQRNTPEKLLMKQDKIASVLSERSLLTRNFLRFLATMSDRDIYVKPDDIITQRASIRQFLEFGAVLKAALQVCKQSIKSGGGHKPIYTQMVSAFGELYFQTTNCEPARIMKHHDTGESIYEIENHPLIHIVRHVAKVIENQLSDELKDRKPPNLAKACRKAAKHHHEHLEKLKRKI